MSTRTLRTLTAVLVAAIALIAFAVSFEAISAYAVAVGAFPHPLRWCAPLLVDTFTLAACLVILARSRDGVRGVYAWSLVVTASTVSVALNVAHAPLHIAARLVAALPPAALLAALELVMSEARRLRARTASAEPAARPAQPGELQASGERTSRQVVRELLAGDQDLTVERVREATGVAAAAPTSCSPRCGPRATGTAPGEGARTGDDALGTGRGWSTTPAPGRARKSIWIVPGPLRAGVVLHLPAPPHDPPARTGLPASLPAGTPAPRWPAGACLHGLPPGRRPRQGRSASFGMAFGPP
jgi:hypothetical protein